MVHACDARAGSTACEVHLGTVGGQFGFCLVHGMASGCVMAPNLTVVEGITQKLEGPAHGCNGTNDARRPVTLGKHLDGLDETSRAGAGNADDHVNAQEHVEATEEKVHVIVQGLFLHVAIVDRSIPQQEGEGRDEEQVANASTEVSSSVTRTGNEDEDTSEHVYDKRREEG